MHLACLMALGACVAASSRPMAEAPRETTLAFGGDVLLGRGVVARAREEGWDAVLDPVRRWLGSADLSVINLESPVGPCLDGGTVSYPRLCGDPAAVPALSRAGVDAAVLANNHALDGGTSGLEQTARLLRRHAIEPLGVEAALTGRPTAERIGPYAILAANLTFGAHEPGRAVPVPSPSDLAVAVGHARLSAPDVPLVVVLHAGREGWPHAQPADLSYARRVVEAGADAVVMQGAHVVRTLLRDPVPVHFGLGNLIFDQRSPSARVGAVLTLASSAGRRLRVLSARCVRGSAEVACPE